MSEEILDDNFSDFEQLRKLLRKSRKFASEPFVRPDEGTITAYVLGQADAEQTQQVHLAMVRSLEFRREMLDLQERLELASQPIGDVVEAPQVDVPELEAFLAAHDTSTAAAQWNRRKPSVGERLVSGLRSILDLMVPRVYVPALAGAAALVLLVARLGFFGGGPIPITAELSAETEIIDPGALISNVSRGAEETTPVLGMRDQVLVEFAKRLRLDDQGTFHIDDSLNRIPPTEPGHTILVRLVNESNELISDCPVAVPEIAGRVPGTVTAWLLALPSRTLYHALLPSDTVNLVWEPGMGDAVCLGLTAPNDRAGFHVMGVRAFELK